MKPHALISASLLASSVALASEEMIVPWSSVQIQADHVGRAGDVIIKAHITEGNISKLSLTAFGKTYILPEEDLKMLAGFPATGIAISHEGGYEILGGNCIHARLERVTEESGKKVTYTAWMTVTEKKGLQRLTIRRSE